MGKGSVMMARYIDADLIKGKLQNTIINSQTAFINTVLIGLLDKAPTEDVQKIRHGEWIWQESGEEDYEQYYVCSICKEKCYFKAKFCADCGAKMDGV